MLAEGKCLTDGLAGFNDVQLPSLRNTGSALHDADMDEYT